MGYTIGFEDLLTLSAQMERQNALLKQHEEATTVNAAAKGDHNVQVYLCCPAPSSQNQPVVGGEDAMARRIVGAQWRLHDLGTEHPRWPMLRNASSLAAFHGAFATPHRRYEWYGAT